MLILPDLLVDIITDNTYTTQKTRKEETLQGTIFTSQLLFPSQAKVIETNHMCVS